MAQRVLRQAVVGTAKISKVLRTKISSATRTVNVEVQPITVRSTPGVSRQPVHPLAFLRQQKRGTKWYTTGPSGVNLQATLRRFLSTGSQGARHIDRTAYLKSNVGSRAVWQSTGRAPFASTLRPNLTGGALPRTAGGYSLPGRTGARYFSHTPAAPAQVVQNVSQAMRAFWLSGQRARFDGVGPNGEKRYRAVGAQQDETARKISNFPKHVPGSFIDFTLSPTITALSPLAAAFPFPSGTGIKPETATTLGEEGFLDVLSVDFARTLKELSAVMNDLKRLSSLGDLPILLEKGNVLRVRFPGVDAETVESFCDDLGITRGLIKQDAEFDISMGVPVALQFPFAPDSAVEKTITSPGGSLRSHRSAMSSISEEDALFEQYMEDNPWLSSHSVEEEGYESMSPPLPSSGEYVSEHASEDFEGLEGIYRFLEECDRARQRPVF